MSIPRLFEVSKLQNSEDSNLQSPIQELLIPEKTENTLFYVHISHSGSPKSASLRTMCTIYLFLHSGRAQHYQSVHKFHTGSVWSVITSINFGDFLASNLQDTYFQVPIFPFCQCYLFLQWEKIFSVCGSAFWLVHVTVSIQCIRCEPGGFIFWGIWTTCSCGSIDRQPLSQCATNGASPAGLWLGLCFTGEIFLHFLFWRCSRKLKEISTD